VAGVDDDQRAGVGRTCARDHRGDDQERLVLHDM
jgi:hypothetical protein